MTFDFTFLSLVFKLNDNDIFRRSEDTVGINAYIIKRQILEVIEKILQNFILHIVI